MSLDYYFDRLAEETKKDTNKIKSLFRRTFAIIKRMLRRRMLESSLIPADTKNLSLVDKRKMLKKVYAEVLTNMGQKRNIPIFNKLIDNVPESYLDYELEIDTESAGEFVDDLINGKGQISDNELFNIAEVIKGVGVPAIINYATGEEKLSKETAKFGAAGINKNVKDYLDSKKGRQDDKFKLPSTATKKELVHTSRDIVPIKIEALKNEIVKAISTKDLTKFSKSKIGKIASGIISSRGTNFSDRIDLVAKTLAKESSYKKANDLFKRENIELEFKTQEEYSSFLSSLYKKHEEKQRVPR